MTATTSRDVHDVATPNVRASLPQARRPSGHVSRRQGMLWSLGVLLVVVGALGAVALVRAGDQRDQVLVMANSVPAGAELTADDITVAEVASDDLVLVGASDMPLVVGSYTKTRILAGQPVALEVLQPDPLVTPGQVVIAVPVTPVQLPAGVREQSVIELVVTASQIAGSTSDTFIARGVVVEFPSFTDDSNTVSALSVEVAPADAARVVAAGRDVSVVLIDPGRAEGE